MKIGDLVQVLPSKAGYYIILGSALAPAHWMLQSLTGLDYYGPMHEKFIEVLSESR